VNVPALILWTSLAIVAGAFVLVAAASWSVGASILEGAEE
jgi:hypothetical protein